MIQRPPACLKDSSFGVLFFKNNGTMSCSKWHKSQPTIMSRPHYIILLFLSFFILFINASKPVQKSKYAWVSFLYGTSYFNPLRVMQASLRRSGTPYDIVTLVDIDVTSHYRNILELDGTIVLDIPKKISNSYSNDPVYQARFGAVMSKLNMFNMTQYEKIVYLDADTMMIDTFEKNNDVLFKCGDFCAVFINPCIFNSGVMVIRPSPELFSDMISKVTYPSFSLLYLLSLYSV